MPKLYVGDCLTVLPTLESRSVDSVVCDPPYNLSFMGREWDTHDSPAAYQEWCRQWASECLRVLRPGGFLLAFGGTRTYHRLACGIEDAGFEMRDSITWLYGQGFPKSRDVSKAIDSEAGAERMVLSEGTPVRRMIPGADQNASGSWVKDNGREFVPTITASATDAAKQWDGWGTALKPASEPIVVARKPLVGTVAQNVQMFGTGALNIDGCRVDGVPPSVPQPMWSVKLSGGVTNFGTGEGRNGGMSVASGRWPANVVLSHVSTVDGEDACADGCVEGCPIAELDRQSGDARSSGVYSGDGSRRPGDWATNFSGGHRPATMYADSGGASRFFPTFRYQAKASKRERPNIDGIAHPTVKPLALVRWLTKLVTLPDGVVLDPFVGSGTTFKACRLEGFQCIGIDIDPDNVSLIQSKLGR